MFSLKKLGMKTHTSVGRWKYLTTIERYFLRKFKSFVGVLNGAWLQLPPNVLTLHNLLWFSDPVSGVSAVEFQAVIAIS